MLILHKHRNFEEQLLEIADSDNTRFEVLTMIIEWGLRNIDRLPDALLSQLEVESNIFMLEIIKSHHCEHELMVMFKYIRGSNSLTILSVRGVN